MKINITISVDEIKAAVVASLAMRKGITIECDQLELDYESDYDTREFVGFKVTDFNLTEKGKT